MISWIQTRLIKNGKWIFSILLIVIIVAFVFVIGNTPGLPGTEQGLNGIDYYGINLNSRDDLEQMDREAALSTYLNTGNPQMPGAQIRQIGLARLALLDLADSHGIPEPGPEAVKRYLRERPIFMGPDGTFNPDAYQQFLDLISGNPAYPPALLDKILSDEVRVEAVNEQLTGETGYTVPYEVYRQAQRDGTEWELKVANFKYTDFDPEMMVSQEDLVAFYETNTFRYEIPERQELRYVYFAPDQFEDRVSAEVEDAALLDYLERNISRYMDPLDSESGEDLAAAIPEPEALLEAKRETILADWTRAQAIRLAEEAAADFAYTFYERQLKMSEDVVIQEAERIKAETARLEPVSQESTPGEAGPGVTRNILQAVRGLNPTQWFTDALPFRDGHAVFFEIGTLDPEIPEFEEVQAKVAADYREDERRRLFNETGSLIAEHIRQELNEGKSFEEAVQTSALNPDARSSFEAMRNAFETDISLVDIAEQAKLDIQFFSFTAMDPPQDLPMSVLRAVRDLEPGAVTDMVTLRGQGGFFAYVQNKDIPQPTPESDLYTDARENLGRATIQFFTSNVVTQLVTDAMPAEAR